MDVFYPQSDAKSSCIPVVAHSLFAGDYVVGFIISENRLFIKYMDKNGEVSERKITPTEVMGLSDYIYLKAYCHTRQAERIFRLDRIVGVAVEAGKE